MAGTDTAPAPSVNGQRPQWRLDLDALVERPAGYITYKGVEYPVSDYLDLDGDEYTKAMQASLDLFDRGAKLPILQQSEVARMILKLLVPTFPEDELRKMKPRKLIAFMVEAMGYANPQTADPSLNPSSASTPGSAATTPDTPSTSAESSPSESSGG